MTIKISTIDAIEKLLTIGEVSASELQSLQIGKKLGLWRLSSDNQWAIATPATVQLLQGLPNLQEACAAILSCELDIRNAWSRIIAARLQELGNRRDITELTQAISILGQASETIIEQITYSTINTTIFTELEKILFGIPAEQAPATPKLLRILGATASLIEDKQGKPEPSLTNVDPLNPAINWVKGRILQLPIYSLPEVGTWEIENQKAKNVLSGIYFDLTLKEINPNDTSSQATMRWVLSRPWIFLLAQIVFTQEAWSAERIAGKLSLELPESKINQFHQPEQILVVITTPTGEEILCGTLAELIIRVLNYLGVSLLTPVSPTEPNYVTSLESKLAPAIASRHSVIAMLLQKQVWQFNPGGSGQPSSYSIHPDFSDSCYRVLGAKYFNRLGNLVTAAIRSSCESWIELKKPISTICNNNDTI